MKRTEWPIDLIRQYNEATGEMLDTWGYACNEEYLLAVKEAIKTKKPLPAPKYPKDAVL
jgi:hypothetical protein